MDKNTRPTEKEIAEILGAKPNAKGFVGRLMPGGIIQYDVPDLLAAVALAEEFRTAGHFKYFRGQRDARWPVVSSLFRANAAERAKANTDLADFFSFARGAPHLVPYLQNDDAIIATAQHHGIAATNFIDFTHSPEVAGWFASDGALNEGEGAIYLVDSQAEKVFAACGGPFQFLHLDVPNLWRLQAQKGLFLEAPGTFNHVWPLDRIVFPHIASLSPIPRHHIYPEKKSALELALDQYVSTRDRRVAFELFMPSINVRKVEVRDEEKITADDALSVPPSWIAGPNERWEDIDVDSTGPALGESSLSSTADLTELIVKRRACANLITVYSAKGEKLQKLQDLINNVWNGMRPHPYLADQIARSIVATVRLHRAFEHVDMTNGFEQLRVAEVLVGPTVEIEMATSGENAARAFVNLKALWLTLKKDVRDALGPEFDPHGNWLNRVLRENWQKPGRNFEGQQLVELFVDQIIPWQVATGRYPVAFSAFHVITLGRP